jgi:hypothetical protein
MACSNRSFASGPSLYSGAMFTGYSHAQIDYSDTFIFCPSQHRSLTVTTTIPNSSENKSRKTKGQQQQNRRNKTAHEPPNAPPVNIQVIADETDNPSKQESKKSPTDWWLTAFTGALVLVAVLQFLAMHRQAGYMRRGLIVSIRSARAAKRSADAAIRNTEALKNAERAHVDIDFIPTEEGSTLYHFKATNFGKSHAIISTYTFTRHHFPAKPNNQMPDGASSILFPKYSEIPCPISPPENAMLKLG